MCRIDRLSYQLIFCAHTVSHCSLPLLLFTARCYTERGIDYGKSFVRPSVCLSVTLRYRDHVDWNISKIIPRLVSLGCSLSADPNIADLLHKMGNTRNFGQNRGDVRKKWLLLYKSSNISKTRQKQD